MKICGPRWDRAYSAKNFGHVQVCVFRCVGDVYRKYNALHICKYNSPRKLMGECQTYTKATGIIKPIMELNYIVYDCVPVLHAYFAYTVM